MAKLSRRRSRRDRKFLQYLVLFFATACFAAVIRQCWHLYRLDCEAKAVQQHIDQLRSEQKLLHEEQRQLHTLGYIEKIAREEYNMVGKEEIPIFIVEDNDMSASKSRSR